MYFYCRVRSFWNKLIDWLIESRKTGATLLLLITLPNIDRVQNFSPADSAVKRVWGYFPTLRIGPLFFSPAFSNLRNYSVRLIFQYWIFSRPVSRLPGPETPSRSLRKEPTRPDTYRQRHIYSRLTCGLRRSVVRWSHSTVTQRF